MADSLAARSRLTVVTVMGIGQVLVWGSSYYLPAVLAQPIADRTGWPLSWVIGALSLALLVSGLVSPKVGALIERHGGRPILMASAALMAVGLATLAMAPDLAVFTLGWLVLGGAMGTGLYDPAFAALGRLYGNGARAAITSLTLIGGFASTACWPLSAVLLERFGWRGTCLAYATINLLVVLPLYRFGLPAEAPSVRVAAPRRAALPAGDAGRGHAGRGHAGRGDGGAMAPAAPVMRGDARYRLLFFLVAVTMTLSSIIAAVVSVHLLTILQQRGVALGTAVALGAVVGPCQVGARLIDLLAGQRTHPVWEGLLSAVFVSLGLGLLLAQRDAVLVGLVVYGGGIGLRSIVRGTLPLALFGPVGYPSLVGRLALPMLLGQAAAPSAGAVLLEHFGGRSVVTALLWTALATLVLSAMLVSFARQPQVRSAG
ncbi:MAG TPA: MFS transporter [Acetobacteraceae bacterium]|nr:MFS transporter [Acetobacteraceae bacterium]